MKKIIQRTILISIIIFLFGSMLIGFGNNEKSVQVYPWPLGTASPKDTATQIFADSFAEEVNRLSGGTMKIQVYPNSTIGGDLELLESCRSSDVPFVIQCTAPQVSFMPQLAIFDLPFVFDDINQARKVVDGEEFYEMIEAIYLDSGFRILGFSDQGMRVTSTNKKIEEFKDLKSLKIRTMENPNHIKLWRSIGANPTPMSFNEVYVGLQQGTIDAQENPYDVIASSKLYEQQKYIVETNHMPHYLSLIVNDSFFESLTKKEQEIITQAAKTAKHVARLATDKRIDEKIAEIQSSGTKVLQISEELKSEIKSELEDLYNDIRLQSGDKIFDAYVK